MCALLSQVLAAGHLAEGGLGQASGLVGRDLAEAAQHDLLFPRLPAAIARTVVDDQGLDAGGVHPALEPVSLSSHAIHGLSEGLSASRGRSEMVILVLATRFLGLVFMGALDDGGYGLSPHGVTRERHPEASPVMSTRSNASQCSPNHLTDRTKCPFEHAQRYRYS